MSWDNITFKRKSVLSSNSDAMLIVHMFCEALLQKGVHCNINLLYQMVRNFHLSFIRILYLRVLPLKSVIGEQ